MIQSFKQSAFTLVELAIVLVIIGLIVGGVLVGQDLIHAAQIRAVVTDIEKYNAAANTFEEKYTGLPGDLLNTKAVQFGFNTAANDAARDGTVGHGDGDGRISDCTGTDATDLGCENLIFWTDLSAAQLVAFHPTLTSITATENTGSTNGELAAGILPKTKLRDNTLLTIYTTGGHNFYGMGEFYTGGPSVGMTGDEAKGLTPLEASNIDQKLDDGLPKVGSIFAIRRQINNIDDLSYHTAVLLLIIFTTIQTRTL